VGPVKPNLEPPGAIVFSDSPLQEVNSPVTLVFNGKDLPVIGKIGWPGQKSLYWVDFQVPSDASTRFEGIHRDGQRVARSAHALRSWRK